MFSLFVWKCRQALKLTLGQPEFFLGISLQLRINTFKQLFTWYKTAVVESKRRAGKRQTKEITIQLAWDQAPHRGEEEEKIGVGENKNRRAKRAER